MNSLVSKLIRSHKALTLAFLLSLLGGVASAQSASSYTYVDAEPGTNTTPSNVFTTAGDAGDNLWRERGFGTNNTIYEASGNEGSEDAPELTVTVPGLFVNAPYDVYVLFYDVNGDSGQDWPIRAGDAPGSTTLFHNSDSGLGGTDAVLASTLTFDSADPKFDDGSNRLLFAGYVGEITTDGSGNLVVYVDDLPAAITSNNRTWFDGIAYSTDAVPVEMGNFSLE